MKRFFAAIILTATMAMPSPLSAATNTENTTHSVATFVASNFKLAITQAIADLRSQGLDIDSAAVLDMVRADLATPYDRDAHTAAYDAVMTAVAQARDHVNASFMADARAIPGAIVADNGLVFVQMTPGNGATPTPESTVTMRYRGVLPDGTVFDEITPDQEPMVSRADQLVSGMTQGLCMMKEGGNYTLYIPAELAYGDQGAGGVIPPSTPLRFDVELVKVSQ